MKKNTRKNYGANIFPIFLRKKNKFKIFSMTIYRLEDKTFDTRKSYISIGKEKFNIKFLFKKGIRLFKKFYFNFYSADINYDKLTELEIQNPIYYHFVGKEDYECAYLYNLLYYRFTIGNHSRVHNYDNMNLCCFIRQTRGNTMGLTLRHKNYTDHGFFKIFFAWLLSLFYVKSKIILLYEKNNEKYEESACRVYEKLIDEGYPAYFILNENSKHWVNIKDKYRKNIIKSFTFKHYLYYFKCRKFIGTETVAHSMELRSINRLINIKRFLQRYKFVFLQHGVMYMVSLDSTERTAFVKGRNLPKFTKIVVSSKLEREHFTSLGGYEDNDLYVTGLPAYDKNKKNKNADKITIMTTWRPWDYNVLESNYKESSYYKMIKNIIKNIPEEYKDKVNLLPHPLVKDKFEKTDLKKYILDEISYDKVLEKTSLLITDYSSISYSAFYRGSNVIFCWNEKDECMSHYGAHLMLNEKNTFGDYSYDYKDLPKLIKNNYNKPQSKEHLNNYRKIVEFHDGKNTERLVECLKKDKFI